MSPLSVLPVEQHHSRFTDSGERIRHVGNSGTGKECSVVVERDASRAADRRTECSVVLGQNGGIEGSDLPTRCVLPLLHVSAKIARNQVGPAGVKRHLVNVTIVAAQSSNQRPVDCPNLDEFIISTRCDVSVVRTDSDSATPSVVGIDRSDGCRVNVGDWPPNQFPVIVRGDHFISVAVVDESHATNPATVAGQASLAIVRQIPSLDRKVLSASENVPTAGIEATREERLVVRERLADSRACRIDVLRILTEVEKAHDSTSRIGVASGSAMGIGRRST